LPCDPLTGTCGTIVNDCDDNISCTLDSCIAGTGCSHVPSDLLCQDSDPCVNNSICNLTAKACTAEEVVCPFQGLYCKTALCIPFDGCSAKPRDCQGNRSNTSCDTFNCSEVNRTCEKKSADCFNFLGIVAGIVVGGVIGGVLGAAAILIFASTSGAAYAISSTSATEDGHKVKHNPLYHGQGKSAELNLC
jgi:hypothetical protein